MTDKKPTAMSIESILEWFDTEIAELKRQFDVEALAESPNKIVLMAIQGTMHYLEGMKAKLVDASFERLDKHQDS